MQHQWTVPHAWGKTLTADSVTSAIRLLRWLACGDRGGRAQLCSFGLPVTDGCCITGAQARGLLMIAAALLCPFLADFNAMIQFHFHR